MKNCSNQTSIVGAAALLLICTLALTLISGNSGIKTLATLKRVKNHLSTSTSGTDSKQTSSQKINPMQESHNEM